MRSICVQPAKNSDRPMKPAGGALPPKKPSHIIMTVVKLNARDIYHRSLLVLLVLTWAISWPVIKVGVATVSPIWFGCLRYLIAAFCLFALVSARGELALPPRLDWPL